MSDVGIRAKVGCWMHERWRSEIVLRLPRLAQACGMSWPDLRNRNEQLRQDPATGGRVCKWQDSSRLTVARVFPRVGIRLLRHVLREWPVRFVPSEYIPEAFPAGVAPVVSILIPVGGTARMTQFELALAAARGQVGVVCEIVVVEQWPTATLRDRLPVGVRYLHQVAAAGEEFNKSKALNAAAQISLGENLLILDADFIMPERFAAECSNALLRVEAVRPARWIFYLDRASSEQLTATHDSEAIGCIESIVSNTPNPLALRRLTYFEIGGLDESYAGWGGEDTEFLDRLRTRKVGEGGWMPILHAWHAPASRKSDGDRNRLRHASNMKLPPPQRILRLRQQQAETGHR